MKIKHELLAPAGDFEKAVIALNYGADAIFVGPKAYSLRARASNFDIEEIAKITKYAHSLGKKVYIVLNIICKNGHLAGFKKYFQRISDCNVDGIICADPFIIDSIYKINPKMPIHISTQQSTMNSKAVAFWKRNHAERIVLGREVDFENLKRISEKTKSFIELEYFIHGAVCIAYSGRCTMSNNFSYRDSNVGGCAHSCRWKYQILNNNEITEDFTMSAKDMNLMEDLKELLSLDIASFKIEGRMKSIHYIATIVSSYKKAIEYFYKYKKINQEYILETRKAENRQTANACFDNKPDYSKMLYHEDERKVKQNFAFIVKEVLDDNKYIILSKNYFNVNSQFEAISYQHETFKFMIKTIYNETKDAIEFVNIPMREFVIEIDGHNKLSQMDIVRIAE
ncbi:MAG: peptidase U32 family protein [Mycoplasmoidaceae bacterium]